MRRETLEKMTAANVYRKREMGNPIGRPHGERDQHEALTTQEEGDERRHGHDERLPLAGQRAANVGRNTPAEIS